MERKFKITEITEKDNTLIDFETSIITLIYEKIEKNQREETYGEYLDRLSYDEEIEVRVAVAENENTSEETLDRLSYDEEIEVRVAVAENENTSEETLDRLSYDEDFFVRERVAENPNTSVKTFDRLSSDEDERVRESVVKKLEERNYLFAKSNLLKDKSLRVQGALIKNLNIPLPKKFYKTILQEKENSLSTYQKTYVYKRMFLEKILKIKIGDATFDQLLKLTYSENSYPLYNRNYFRAFQEIDIVFDLVIEQMTEYSINLSEDYIRNIFKYSNYFLTEGDNTPEDFLIEILTAIEDTISFVMKYGKNKKTKKTLLKELSVFNEILNLILKKYNSFFLKKEEKEIRNKARNILELINTHTKQKHTKQKKGKSLPLKKLLEIWRRI